MNAIRETFATLRAQGRKAFIPYIMAGDPDLSATRERVLLLERCGADIIELGVPFSDPVADGPTIQRAAERALGSGTTLRSVLSLVSELRQQTRVPLVLMTYYNIIFRYNEVRFASDAVNAGVDGAIIPDLPPEEAETFMTAAGRAGLGTIFLVAPTSTRERIDRIVAASTAFVYYVSMTGITGATLALESQFRERVGAVKEVSDSPVAVGFGISGADDARAMAEVADGVIVGSALVKAFFERPGGAAAFARELREAIDSAS
jgi:tryptophan synthase alpha chain